MSPKVPKPRTRSKGKAAPKAAPLSVTKAASDVKGPRPLSLDDMRFCAEFVQTGKQVDAFRAIKPDAKDPHKGAFRMMQRPEIREHIKAIYAKLAKRRDDAADLSARATLLTLELADDRLTEILQQRRKTSGEMLSRDVKQLLIPGATMVYDDDGNEGGYKLSPEAVVELGKGAPVEDAQLLGAIKLAYDRKSGIIKAEKPVTAGPVIQMLYKPNWFGARTQPQTLEATA